MIYRQLLAAAWQHDKGGLFAMLAAFAFVGVLYAI
jgi:hypothetical protein